MHDPLEACQQVITCPFCQTKFTDVVKLIPDCGNFICGACFDGTERESGPNRSDTSAMLAKGIMCCPRTDCQNASRLAGLLPHPIEKPLSEQAKKLQASSSRTVQEQMANLQAFDPRDFMSSTLVSSWNRRSATLLRARSSTSDRSRHICRIGSECTVNAVWINLRHHQSQPSTSQMATNGHWCHSSGDQRVQRQVERLFQESQLFGQWQSSRSCHSTNKDLQIRMKRVDQDLKSRALCDTVIQFKPCDSFCSIRKPPGRAGGVVDQVQWEPEQG